MKASTRTSDGSIAATLPTLAVGTFESRGIVFLRAQHLVEWLDDVYAQIDADEVEHDPRNAAAIVEEIRCRIAEVGGL